jgi:hypothetical protein
MEIRETSEMNLTEYIGRESIHLIAGCSKNVVVDGKIFLHNVRAIHFANGDGYHVEFVCYDETMNPQRLYVYNVSSIMVDSVYGEKLLFNGKT